MELTQIKNSSSVVAIGYDITTTTITIIFKKTGKYEYTGCSQMEYDMISNAESIGAAVRIYLKDKPYKRID